MKKTTILLIAVFVFLVIGLKAEARTFTVDSENDTVDSEANCVCLDDTGHCTLRAAIMEANACAGSDTIEMPTDGVFELQIGRSGENDGATGDLDISSTLIINGNGSTIRNLVDSEDRILDIHVGAEVTINNLHFDGNDVHVNGMGACIFSEGTLVLDSSNIENCYSTSISGGGAIVNGSGATMTIIGCNISHSTAENGPGGGIYSEGELTVMISAIVYNTAEKGGGIAQNDHYPVTLGAVTISNNQSYYDGGGIYIFSINEAFVLNGVTVAENTCCSSVGSNGGGGIYTEVDIVSFENTIIANNSDSGLNAGPNCYGTIISNDYNIVTDDTGCTIEGTVDHFYTTETLGSLDDNGGDTLTHAILADGNAIDGGNDITCLYMDQRGFNRRGVCDIGAYEYQYVCGDALVEVSEECDDGNSANTDACLNTCVEASCGDGYLQTGVEECDDSNTDDGDGCSSACEIEEEVANVCGDGVAMEDEECDDGNTANTDACLNTCQSAACGDGYLQSGVEECDDNNTDDGDNCSGTCTLEEGYENTCGDDIVAGDEECDDGNTDAGDGCDATCMNEGTVAEQACGNGVVNEGEECDDGNSTDGDGCSASCTDEESATHQSSGGGCSLIIPN